MGIKIKCIHCEKSNYAKKGFRKTERRGKIQKYICLECGKYFTNDDGFYRMRNDENKITMAIDMYLSALSSRKMRNQLSRHFDYKISHVSILDWVRKYTLKVQDFVNKQQPTLKGRFYADETLIDCEKRKDAFWCAIDWDTRFISGYHYSTNRSVDDAIDFLKKVTEKKLPRFIQTDAAKFYPDAMTKLFFRNYIKAENSKKYLVEHIINNVSKTKKHNVRIETVFSKIRDRVNNFRGLKALWSAKILMAGIAIQHNYIENHTTTGKLPCEFTGLNLEMGKNKWLSLIRINYTSS